MTSLSSLQNSSTRSSTRQSRSWDEAGISGPRNCEHISSELTITRTHASMSWLRTPPRKSTWFVQEGIEAATRQSARYGKTLRSKIVFESRKSPWSRMKRGASSNWKRLSKITRRRSQYSLAKLLTRTTLPQSVRLRTWPRSFYAPQTKTYPQPCASWIIQ